MPPTDSTAAALTVAWTAWDQLTDHLDATGVPWPPIACTLDVQAHEAALAAGLIARRPGRPYYALRWRVTDYEAGRRLAAARAGDAGEAAAPRADQPAPPSASAGGAVDSPSPADHQPHADAVDPVVGVDRRDSTASPCLFPTSSLTSSPVAAPISTDPVSLGRSPIEIDKGVQGGAAGELSARADDRLHNEDKLGDEARLFLSIWRAWTGPKRRELPADHPARQWNGRADEAVGWFLTEIMGSADFRGLDIVAGLREWADYLDDKAKLWGRPGTANRGRFPSRWKQALRRWFENRRAWGRDNSSRTGYTSTTTRGHHATPAAPARGTWAGARQPAGATAPRRPSADDFDGWDG